MELDLKHFASIILQTETKPEIDFPIVSDYVMKHIYEPLRRGEKIRFADLDFNAFGEENLHELNELMEAYEHLEHKLIQISRHFCETASQAVRYRAFC